MGASTSNTKLQTQPINEPVIQDPFSLTSSITSRYLAYTDVRYLARDPFSHSFYISSPQQRETYLLSPKGTTFKLKHRIAQTPKRCFNPFSFRATLSLCLLASRSLLLITHQTDVAVCMMDGELITKLRYERLAVDEQLITICADSMESWYTLSQVTRHGAMRGEITEVSCQLTLTEMFNFGAKHIEMPRDMCKSGNKLYVLHESDKCVLVFSVDGELLSGLVSTLPRNFPNALFNPMHMTVDSKQNIIISAWGEDTISLINSRGAFVGKIRSTLTVPFSKPSGLYYDELNRTLYCLTKGEQPQLISVRLPTSLSSFS